MRPSPQAPACSSRGPRGGKTLAAVAALAAAAAIGAVGAVDHSKFRTCQQGSFCRRFKTWSEHMAAQ